MSGKPYQGEHGIIGCTSWPSRINTVGLTLYSLYRVCPKFHICLTLSSEEFPNKEADLPTSLLAMLRNNMFELLWVKKNYRSFKKWVFAAQKYPGLPVISADDDCLYIVNYAHELYNKWLTDMSVNGIRYEYGAKNCMQGPSSLYYLPRLVIDYMIASITDSHIKESNDDAVIYEFMQRFNCKFGYVHRGINKPYIFHDTTNPLHDDSVYRQMKCFSNCFIDNLTTNKTEESK